MPVASAAMRHLHELLSSDPRYFLQDFMHIVYSDLQVGPA